MRGELTPAEREQLCRVALAWLVRVHGRWPASAGPELERWIAERCPGARTDELRGAFEEAEARFWSGGARWFLCAEEKCRGAWAPGPGPEAWLAPFGVPVAATACVGACGSSPIATLRVGERCDHFAPKAPADWERIGRFAARAARAGTLLADASDVLALRFDPVHGDEAAGEALEPLSFLVGVFSGRGRYAAGPGWFHKEICGRYEAGGRILSLRMAVTHELRDGRKDRHEALVLLASDTGGSGLRAEVLTDTGARVEYAVERAAGGIRFADRVTHHGVAPRPARKSLLPEDDALLERVELVRDDGGFELYSEARLARVVSGCG